MKGKISLFLLSCVFTIFLNATVFAGAGATIDKSQVSKGIVVINLTDFTGKTIKAQVEKGTEKYLYTLIKGATNLPLQMGTGDYKITVLEGVSGNKYMPLASETVNAKTIDEKELYTASIPQIEYSVSTDAVTAFKTLTKEKTTNSDKIAAVYNNIIENYSYDFNKAATVSTDYVPVVDTVYKAKKGICYDYASLMGAALRSQGIPTRMVMGYTPDIEGYHAWNEILINDQWVAVDTTYDAQVVKAGMKATMQKDKSKMTVLKIY